MYFNVLFQPTGERAIYLNDDPLKILTVKDLLEWTTDRFAFEAGSGESGNRHLSLRYDNTELQPHWFLQDLNIRFGATVKCIVIEVRVPDYRLFLPIRNETFEVFDSKLHPIETTILQLRIVASNKSGIPLSAFRLINDANEELFDHIRLSQYDIDFGATLTMKTWIGWSDFFTYTIKGYTKAVLKLLSSDELVRQYMLQVALYIASHYGNVDLARSLLQLGARPDRPVGHHPSRQWCSADCLDPEYFRCPVHEAIHNQQIGIILLFGGRDSSIFQKPDGYGIKPWRIALRQSASPKQREAALFILSKQFGSTRVSNRVSLPHRHIYVFKQWAERARERVYAKYGVQYSSLKRKPLIQNGESLLGYKILVDGYNNDFQDYYSTAEYAREKTRQTNVVLDEREKLKLKNTETFMKSFLATNSLQMKPTSTNPSPTLQMKGAMPSMVPTTSSDMTVGRRLWARVAAIFRVEAFLLRNAIDLIETGLITDDLVVVPNRSNVPGAANAGLSREASSLSSTSSTTAHPPVRIHFFADRFRLIREMMYKPDKAGRTLRHLSGVEWSKVRRGQNNAWETQRASTALTAKKKEQLRKMKTKKKTVRLRLPDIQRGESSSAVIPLPRERPKIDYRVILRGSDKLYHETMYNWERTVGVTLPSLSIQGIGEATKFHRKSWMRQVDMAIQFATNRNRRVFQSVS